MIDPNTLGPAVDTAEAQQSLGDLTVAIGNAAGAVGGLATAASAAEQSIQRIVTAAGQLGTQQQKAATSAGQQAAGGQGAAAAADSNGVTDKATAAAKAAMDAQNKAWNDLSNTIQTGLTDSLYTAITSGKDFFDSFSDGIEKWFKTTVLKMAVQGVVSLGLNSIGLGPLIAQAASGGASGGITPIGVAGVAGTTSSVTSGSTLATLGTFANSFGTGFAALGDSGLSSAVLEQALAAIKAGNVAQGLGMFLGSAGTVIGAAALVGNALGAFRSDTVTDTGIVGTLGYQSSSLDAYTEHREGGTIFDGPSYTRVYSDADQGIAEQVSTGADAVYDKITSYAKALGLNADAINGYTKAIDVSFQGMTPDQVQATLDATFNSLADTLTNQIPITDGKTVTQTTTNPELTGRSLSGLLSPLLTSAQGTISESGTQGQLLPPDALASLGSIVYATADVRDLSANDVANYKAAIASIKAAATDPELIAGLDKAAQALEDSGQTVTTTITGIAAYAKAGETSSQTLTRLADSLTAVNNVFSALGETSKILAASLKSADLASSLVDQFGSTDALSSAASTYYQDFYSSAEKKTNSIQALGTDFNANGVDITKLEDASGNLSRTLYRNLLDGLDTTTQAGINMYGYLLRMAPAFAAVSDSLDDVTTAAQNAADGLKQTASDAYDTLDRSVTAEKATIDKTYQDAVDATQKSIDGLTDSVQKLQSLSDRLGSVLDGFASDPTLGMSQQEASAQIAAAIAIARSSGQLPDVESLNSALSVISQPVSMQAKNAVDYLQRVDQQVALVSQLNTLTDDQLGAQKTALQVAQQQLVTLGKNHEDDLARLDNILSAAKLQIEAINGVNTSVLSVADALANLNGAVKAAGGTGQVTDTGTTVANGSKLAQDLDAAYESSIGREIDAAGLAYWTQQVQSQAITEEQAISLIENSPEAQEAQKKRAAGIGSTPAPMAMSQNLAVSTYADGGFSSAGWAVVGEQGPELAHFGAPAQVFPAAQARPMLAGSSDGVERLLGQILARLTDDRTERNMQAKAAGAWRFDMLKRTKRIENNTGAVVPEEETA